jgi:CDP-diacylglycerol--glycerol-3-phosphate 3-phosphatidyltransferase
VAAADGLVISASRMGKFKMAAQVAAVTLLIASSTSGRPPVENFGDAFPAIQFWTVKELRAAFGNVFGGVVTATDLQVLLYTAGRAMLWVVVLSAIFSMYEYFRAFYRAAVDRSSVESAAAVESDAALARAAARTQQS